MSNNTQILFGDIHNHNAYGYGIGSLARSIDIAQTHLDFFAFTGHSSWHDMEVMEGGREQHWLKGFDKLKDGWGDVQNLIADANQDDEFSAFLGFEWHSSFFGDQCVVFPDDHQPIAYPDHIQKLREFCVNKNALMIPHHLAYPSGSRGVNWGEFDECCTPVVEIFSEHGNSEDDRGPYTYFNHSMGPRESSQTVKAALEQGMKFGFVASSDSHNGFPGAYGEGLLAVHSKGLDRASIIEAINNRHTYALTGDRILVDFTVDGAMMGSTIEAGGDVEISFDVRCPDELDVIEIIQDGEIIHRAYPKTKVNLDAAVAAPFQIRLEWGWGPWGDLALDRIADWAFDLKVNNGKICNVIPCLQSGPFDENRRHRFDLKSETELGIKSYSARDGGYRQNPNQSVVLELEGSAATELKLAMSQPTSANSTVTIQELHQSSASLFTGAFPKESYQWHRIVPQPSSHVSGKTQIQITSSQSNIYLRVKQQNGHIAWASPVFINYS
jgi:hypothetical protein